MPAPDYRWLHSLADRNTPAFAAAVRASVEQLTGRVTDEAADAALQQPGEPHALIALLDEWQVTKELKEREPVGLYAATLAPAAAATVEATLALSLTLTSPPVLRAAERLTAHLIRDVTEATKQAVRQIIRDAWRDGTPPRESAKLIRRVIGLDRRRAIALGNYTRAQTGVPNGDARAAKYAARLVRDRALTIARTETIRAANAGVQLGWTEMQKVGLLPASMQQQWVTTPDDRLCELCAPMSGQRIPVQGAFQSTVRGVLPSERVTYAGGSHESPPLHPRCRCTVAAAFE